MSEAQAVHANSYYDGGTHTSRQLIEEAWDAKFPVRALQRLKEEGHLSSVREEVGEHAIDMLLDYEEKLLKLKDAEHWQTRYYEQQALHTEATGMLAAERDKYRQENVRLVAALEDCRKVIDSALAHWGRQ